MATRRYSISWGEQREDIVEAAGAAVATKPIELTFDLASAGDKQQLLNALRNIIDYITQDTYPPA